MSITPKIITLETLCELDEKLSIDGFEVQLRELDRDCLLFFGATIICGLGTFLFGVLGGLALHYGVIINSELALYLAKFGVCCALGTALFFGAFVVKAVAEYSAAYKDLTQDKPAFEEVVKKAVNWEKHRWELHRKSFDLHKEFPRREAEFRLIGATLVALVETHQLNREKCGLASYIHS